MNRASAALLVFLAGASAACGRAQPPPSPPTTATVAPAATAEELAFLGLLPASGALPGWSRVKEPHRYGQADLWEYIDGAAEAYLAFGFQELATGRYARAGTDLEMTVEIFRMADSVSAFGIFADQRPASCDDVRAGAEGCYAGGMLAFWSGPYFVKLTAFKDSPQIRDTIGALGSAVATGLGNPGAKPAQLDWFPPKGLVPQSARYVPKDVLGQAFLANAFEARYADGSKNAKLTVIAFDSAEAAGRALAGYRTFIESTGGPTRPLAAPGDGGFAGTDAYYGTVVAARAGSSFAVAASVSSEKAGAALIEACFARMRGSR